jgi:hypothetical protein
MPVERQPPIITPATLIEEPLKTAEQSITDSYALALVNETYWAYEQFRTMNHDRRWNTHDSLYFGYVPPRVWDGSNVARAAYTQPIVFDQVEASLPAITNSIFGIGPEWFQVDAEPGTDPKEAKDIQNSLAYTLEHPKDELGSNAITEIKLAIKNTLLYGNGGVSVEWSPTLNRPVVEWVDLRDFYIDPGLIVPNIDEGRSVIRRKFMTIDEIMQLKKDPRMSIPSGDILWYMAKNVPQANAENTKRVQEALRGIYYSPGFSDFIPLPADQKIEVLIYYSKSRIIWVLNKEWIAYNGPNPYGFIPFAFSPCYIVPSRFYAQSIADVQENNQRYIEALLNAHYDELTLLLHPPRVQKRSTLLTPAQQKWRPGVVFSADNKDDVSLLQVNNNTQNVFTDIQYLELSAERRTGINGVSSGSAPRPSNANRTLGGMQMQQQGSGSRLSEIVNNIETYLLVPVLYKLQKLLQFHTRPGQALPASSPQGQYYEIESSTVQKKVRFRMLAASRMVTKQELMQVLPFWMQTISTGNIMSSLQQTGRTVDFDELFRMIQDATGVAKVYSLIRPMNQQEHQATQQPPPQVQADMQKAQQEGQTRKEIMQMKVQGDLQKENIKKQPNPWEIQAKQAEMQMEAQQKAQEMQMEMVKAAQELKQKQQMAQIELAAKHEQHKMDLQKKQADVQVANQASQNEREQGQMDHQMKMTQMLQQLQGESVQAQTRQGLADKYPKGVQQASEPGQATGKPPKKTSETRHKARPPKAT